MTKIEPIKIDTGPIKRAGEALTKIEPIKIDTGPIKRTGEALTKIGEVVGQVNREIARALRDGR